MANTGGIQPGAAADARAAVDLFHLGVKALIRHPDGRILLLQVNLRELSGYTGPAYWDIPGGRLHRGATVEATLRREVREETALEIAEVGRLVGASISNIRIPVERGDVGLVLFVYECRLTNIGTPTLSSEHVDWQWFAPDDAVEALAVKYPRSFTETLKGL